MSITSGFDLVSDRPIGPAGRWVPVTPKGAHTSITLVTGFGTMPPAVVKGIVLEMDDLAALRERGIEIEGDAKSPRGAAG